MSNNIKINRARNLSNLGNNPRSFEAMLKIIPASVVSNINSTDLSLLIDIVPIN